MTHGIYLVANLRSQSHCENLIYSIRKTGCRLPIRLIPYGGEPINSPAVLSQVEVTPESSFPAEGRALVEKLTKGLSCPRGFVLRYLAFFSDWDSFLYSDNDIVALMDWSELFNHFSETPTPDLIHADEEYTTKGVFNFKQPDKIISAFGPQALEQAITAGHFLCRRDPGLLADILKALDWMNAHPEIVIPHDQTLLHLAALIGDWRIRNLCKSPDGWGSSWAGDYQNPLALIHAINAEKRQRISHLHYSGDWPDGSKQIDVLLDTFLERNQWNRHAAIHGLRHALGINQMSKTIRKVRKRLGC
jgi:hypothetical protein